MEKITKKEMAIIVEAALTVTKVEDVRKYAANGPDAYLAKRIRAQMRRRFGDLERAYRLALSVCKKEGLLDNKTESRKVYAAAFDVLETVGYADDASRPGFNLAALKSRAAELVKQDAEERARGGAFLPSCFLEVIDMVINCAAPHNRAIPEALMNRAADVLHSATIPQAALLEQVVQERVAEGKARAEKEEQAQQDNAPDHIKALRESIAWWNERVTSKIKEDVPYTERKNNETPAWFDYAVSVVRAYESEFNTSARNKEGENALREAVNVREPHDLNVAMLTAATTIRVLRERLSGAQEDIMRLRKEQVDLRARFDSVAHAANSHASTLAAESRQHEETRQKLQEALVRLEPLREAASTLLHGVTRRDDEMDGLKERAEAAELTLRKVAETMGFTPEQAARIATGK